MRAHEITGTLRRCCLLWLLVFDDTIHACEGFQIWHWRIPAMHS